ncbi:MAG: hypothetical protein AB7Y46_11870 [Armatimonadota bacterium]
MRALLAAVYVLSLACISCEAQDALVTVDTSVRHQTILGWGKTTPWAPAPDLAREIVIDRAVNDLGITRLRYEPPAGNRPGARCWEWLNDNDDPREINWDALDVEALDQRARNWIVPFKDAIEARGDPFSIYVSPSFFDGGSSGSVPPWYLRDPEEYAEFAASVLLRLRDTWGVTADYYCICNEAGNNNPFTPQVVAQMIRATVPRLRELGFPTMIQFPESINVAVAMRYIEALQGQTDLWPHIGLIAYHLYGNNDRLGELREFALARGLPTAQTEFMNLTIDHLYTDLTVGGCSYWEIYGLASPDYATIDGGISSDSFRGGNHYWRFRQVTHYVRPGAVRVEATCSDPALRALAFDHNGRVTVVLINTGEGARSRSAIVAGLPPGMYGICRTTGNGPYEEGQPTEVVADGRARLTVAADSVYTVYPRTATNLPPTITAWRARPAFLHVPQASVTLSVAATDPDLDGLRCAWRVIAQPEGAQASIAAPNAASAQASGLSLPGEYLFAVEVADGRHTVEERLIVRVFAENQPPVPVDVHNRIPVRVTVADGKTLLRGGGRDIEGDPLTRRWSVVRQPQGAKAVLAAPTEDACEVSGLTVPGDYVFRFELSDPTHTVAEELTVPVYQAL